MSKNSIERALADPEGTFRDPLFIVGNKALTEAEKIKILLDWRQDLLELQHAGEENMPGKRGDSDVAARLSAVSNALIALGHESD
jgi:hypothetical protein